MSDSESSASSSDSDSSSTSDNSFVPQYPTDLGWHHPGLVQEAFYGVGVTSRQARSPSFRRQSTESKLFQAVCDNDVALVENLLVEGHDPNAIFQLKTSFERDTRSYTQYPIHRAVQTGNKDVVDILLKHGSDPNYRDGQGTKPLYLLFRLNRSSIVDSDGRRPSDPVIVEMLLKAGATITLSDQNIRDIIAGELLPFNRWSLLEMLVTVGTYHNHANFRNLLIEKCRNYKKDTSCVFFTLVTKCGESDSNGKCGYGVLESCLKGGLEPDVLRHGLKLAIDHVVPNAVLLMIKAGADVNFEFTDGQEEMVTPFDLVLNRVNESVSNLPTNVSVLTHISYSKLTLICRDIDARFSVLWLLAKSGATCIWSRDVGCRLVQVRMSLRSVYGEVDRLIREEIWSLEHYSAVQNHLQRCLDIIQKIPPLMSLLDLCRIAVRKALGSGLEDKLEQLGLPVPVKDCILHHDLQAIVDGIVPLDEGPERRLPPGLQSSLRGSLLTGFEIGDTGDRIDF